MLFGHVRINYQLLPCNYVACICLWWWKSFCCPWQWKSVQILRGSGHSYLWIPSLSRYYISRPETREYPNRERWLHPSKFGFWVYGDHSRSWRELKLQFLHIDLTVTYLTLTGWLTYWSKSQNATTVCKALFDALQTAMCKYLFNCFHVTIPLCLRFVSGEVHKMVKDLRLYNDDCTLH